MAESNARKMYKKYPLLFMAMYVHSRKEDPTHPDDISVIYSKLMANAQGKEEPYWTPEKMKMEPIYEEFRKLADEINQKAAKKAKKND